jgi:hypothetical protein
VQMLIPQSPSNSNSNNAAKPGLMPGMPAPPPQFDLMRPSQSN